MRRLTGQAGMSLVEATIILLVLMLLTGVLAPSIFDYFKDAQMVKVKEDCEVIGVTVARLVRDVGPCLLNGRGPTCTTDNRAEILWSDGPVISGPGLHTTGATEWFPPAGTATHGPYNWFNDMSTDPAAHGTPMVGQFVTNWSTGNPALPGAQIYADISASRSAWSWTYPVMGLGWRGAYISSPIGPDPWGLPYFVNSVFLSVARNAPLAAGWSSHFIGARNGGWPYDVFCISGGPNQTFETMFAPNAPPYGTVRGGDDFIYVIQGATR
jgi:type II secretory pathway pseudopilin PulG